VQEILLLDDSGCVVDVMELPSKFAAALDGAFKLTSGFDVTSASVPGEAAAIETTCR
jgi:hypothetical protein